MWFSRSLTLWPVAIECRPIAPAPGRHFKPFPSLRMLCFLVVVCITAQTLSANAAELRVRKNVLDLTASEKSNYVAAVLQMKVLPSLFDTNYNAYDWLVKLHKLGFESHLEGGSMIHMSPPFFPWHREFLRAFELELNRAAQSTGIVAQITIPYWDWTDTNATLAVFRENFMGGNGGGINSSFTNGAPGTRNSPYRVANGPFGTQDDRTTRFPINTDTNVSGSSSLGAAQFFLQRSFATHTIFNPPVSAPGPPPVVPNNFMLTNLPTAEQVALGRAMTNYDMANWDYTVETNLPYLSRTSFRNYMEGHTGATQFRTDEPFGDQMHGRGHLWVNGSMGAPSSPNEPAFWLHHANLDRIWAEWQDAHGIGNFPAAWFYMTHANGNTNTIMAYATITNLLYGFATASNYNANVRVVDALDLRASGVRYQTQPIELPVLTISLSGTNALLATLATPGFIYQLEKAVRLGTPWEVWCGPVTASVRSVNFTVPVPPGTNVLFFRARVSK